MANGQTPQPKLIGPWRKSSYSGGNGGSCVMVANTENGGRAVRHSKDTGPSPKILHFDADEWRAFILGVHANEFS